uniref:Endonuclease/exonuclease/phosphatase domain-containing protein n=1 Tax=Kalanchoe fedtschenkoi TaxID=63787 RepID=A0A7N1A8R6_KALFE
MLSPWAIMGDFNCLYPDERTGSPVLIREILELSSVFQNCNITDIPFSGFKYTWTNKREDSARIFCKLDRVSCNIHWMQSYPASHAIFLAPGVSDHCP